MWTVCAPVSIAMQIRYSRIRLLLFWYPNPEKPPIRLRHCSLRKSTVWILWQSSMLSLYNRQRGELCYLYKGRSGNLCSDYKAYCTQVAVLSLIACNLAYVHGNIDAEEAARITKELKDLPQHMQQLIDSDQYKAFAKKNI